MFYFPLNRAYAEDSSSVKHNPRAEPSEKVKQEEEEGSGTENAKAVASGDEEAQQEGKKKKRSGFRDRKVPNSGVLHLQLSHCGGKRKGENLQNVLFRLWYSACLAFALYLWVFLRDLTVLGTCFFGMQLWIS